MMLLTDFFFYVLFAASVFVYGIGINRSFSISEHPRKLLNGAIKMFISISSSSAITYLIAVKILLPVHLTEAYPLAAVLVFSTISIFIESVVRITTKKSAAEYTVAILSVLLGVNESSSLFECVVISCFCAVSFLISILVFYMLRKKFANKAAVIIISLCIIIIAMHFWNVSWFSNFGGIG